MVNILYQLFFKRYLSLKDADDEQIKFANELKSIDNGPKSVEKKLFMNNVVLFLTAREKVLNNFENRLFPIENLEQELEPELEPEPEQEPELEPKPQPERKPKPKHRESREEFLSEIVDEEKDINEEILRNYFKYQTPASLVKDSFQEIKIKRRKLNI